jgi:uncharacterized protein YciI
MFAASFYSVRPGRFHEVAAVYPRHRAYLDEFALDGDVIMIGTFGNPEQDGSMAIFRSRQAAERFIQGDPFVVEELVTEPKILDWDPLIFDN